MSSTATSAVSKITPSFAQYLRRKIFKHVPHGILTQYPEHIVRSLPETFVKDLPVVPAGIVKITLHKSPYHSDKEIQGTIAALGLRKRYRSVFQKNTPEIRGMIHKARTHLSVEEINNIGGEGIDREIFMVQKEMKQQQQQQRLRLVE
ncbi:hypothetical protein DFA_02501 [Cavenderia fasciculata]|uniref:Large ribosomal subunit protein uL30m n=1 Tax=Cavenderia fasciculata TaxID=261658 RepID=F4PZJ8_CACFS|nr:uncharacterized protein DFA_02501 [Cavenderia fasciculata]EGG18762.1 hypothetical protein DFA_02501 [Cavenderia fasciculata]|eukprot:XP_004357224.1 hypothetical protein DFA_02501 [Cavenderia fasciculata]